MRDFLNKNKYAVGGILAVVALVWAYFMFFSGSSSPLLSSGEDTQSPVSQEILVTLSNLHTIKLDNSLFSDPAFISLNDFGVTIPLQAIGRRNPFAPFVSTASSKSGPKLPSGTH